MRKVERYAQIHRLATEMALTGDHGTWSSIELALRDQGYDDARAALDQPNTRNYLDMLCAQAQKTRLPDDRH